MKLIVQIPALNEEETLAATVRDIPRAIQGVDCIEVLVIDDGSTDRTSQIAKAAGVNHIIRNKRRMGLARSFARGIDYCIGHGADIIVNTDADNQYCGADIALLVKPIIEGRADVVVGDRQTSKIDHFSPAKKLLQRFGSFVVRRFSGVDVPDAVSGFRAISRDAALRINIVSYFSYTIEMLIQVGHKGLAFTSVPIRTNPVTRQSRLFSNVFRFIERSANTLIRMYAMYRPLRVFSRIGMIVAFIGVIPMVRFLYDYLFVSGQGKIQSLVIGSALLTIGVLTFLLGLIADLTNHNRALIEQVLIKVRMLEAAQSHRLGPGEQQTEPKELRYGRNRKSAQQRADIKQARELIEQQEEHIL
jgi:glycosyltransferase involved in cell wall biosynthesis